MVIEHVAMYVNNLEKARDFFVSLLNGKSNDGYYNEKIMEEIHLYRENELNRWKI